MTVGLREIYEKAAGKLTAKELAAELGEQHVSTVYQNARRFGIKLKSGVPNRGRHGPRDLERAESMVAMYLDGLTLEEIGQTYGVSRERARQIMRKYYGIRANDGGASVRWGQRRADKIAAREAMAQAKYGCSYEQLLEIRVLGADIMRKGQGREKTPMGAYQRHRCNHTRLGHGYDLTFWDWWTLWLESGKFDQSGVGPGRYGMNRIDPTKGFVKGNVVVLPFERWNFFGWRQRRGDIGDNQSIRETRDNPSESVIA